MRARRFLALVLAATLSLLGLALGAGWLVWQRSPLQLQHQALALPRAARFVPRDASLGLFLQSDPERPVEYARALASTRQRRQAAAAVARLRNGAFAAAGLDYEGELAGWLDGETALALLASEPGSPPDGWLLALRSRDGDGARRFLQRFWQTRSLAGTGLQVSSYRGMGLISGRGALVGREPVPIATALIDDDLVLLGSGRGVLEQALDVSQIDELNLAGDPAFRGSLERLGQGAVLLQARPDALEPWLGLGSVARLAQGPPPVRSLTAALRPRGRSLELEALLELPAAEVEVAAPAASTSGPSIAELSAPEASAPPPSRPESAAGSEPDDAVRPVAAAQPEPEPDSEPDAGVALGLAQPPGWQPRLAPQQAAELTAGLPGGLQSLALLQDPAHWPDVWHQLLLRALDPDGDGPLPAKVAAADAGPLLWSRSSLGWLMATPADRPDPAALEPALASLGLVASTVESPAATPLEVWTHLEALPYTRRRRDTGSQLSLSLAGARQVDGGRAWWGQTLAVLEERRTGGGSPRELLQALAALGLPQAPLQWATGSDQARGLLGRWSTWRLLSRLAGQPLDTAVSGVALGLEPLPGAGAQRLHLIANLQFG